MFFFLTPLVSSDIFTQVPGHHLQIALETESTELPKFRQFSYLVAYTEGWALYAEGLGFQMDMYTDDVLKFGRYSIFFFFLVHPGHL